MARYGQQAAEFIYWWGVPAIQFVAAACVRFSAVLANSAFKTRLLTSFLSLTGSFSTAGNT